MWPTLHAELECLKGSLLNIWVLWFQKKANSTETTLKQVWVHHLFIHSHSGGSSLLCSAIENQSMKTTTKVHFPYSLYRFAIYLTCTLITIDNILKLYLWPFNNLLYLVTYSVFNFKYFCSVFFSCTLGLQLYTYETFFYHAAYVIYMVFLYFHFLFSLCLYSSAWPFFQFYNIYTTSWVCFLHVYSFRANHSTLDNQ